MLFSTLYGPDSKPAESRRVSAARILPFQKKRCQLLTGSALIFLMAPENMNVFVARFYGEDIAA